jgi:putative chitinase
MQSITVELLTSIVPAFATSRLDKVAIANTFNNIFSDQTPAGDACTNYQFSTINRRAAFIAQTAEESAGYHRLIENLNYSQEGLLKTFPTHFSAENVGWYVGNMNAIGNRVYGGRLGNGPEASGDGFKYRGRGLIQLTGKDNYQAFSMDMGIDCINNPDYLATIPGAFLGAIWYWMKNHLHSFADADDIKGLTHAINGGYNGLDVRTNYYIAAKNVIS